MAAIDWFIPSHLREGHHALRRARVLVGTAFGLTLAFIAGILARLAIGAAHPGALVVAVASVAVVLAVPFVLRATGSLKLAGGMILVDYTASAVAMSVFAGGLASPMIMAAPLAPLLAVFLIDSRAAIVTAVVLSLVFVVLALLPLAGVELRRAHGDRQDLLARALVLLMSMLLVTFIAAWHDRQRSEVESRLVRDVAERKRTEAERETMLAELADKNAELERFTYTVSHDLKSPLITIRSFLGLLEKDLEDGDAARVRKDVSHIANAAKKMQLLVDDLLELTRIRRQAESWSEVSLAAVARDVVELLAGRITERHARVEIAPDLPSVRGDRTLLSMVYQNLIENALKYSANRRRPRVTVGLRRAGGKTVYFVGDNGVGIAPGDLDRVFGLFEQLDPQESGTGIGLTTVKRAVEVHGGRVWVESEGEGTGSTFCFTLPESDAGAGGRSRRPPG